MLDAGTIFDSNEAAFSAAMGTLDSAVFFRERYLDPATEADFKTGFEIEGAFLNAVCEYQREGFIIGFKAAVQLLMECMPSGAAVR